MKKVVIVMLCASSFLFSATGCKTEQDLIDGCVWAQVDDEGNIREQISYKNMQRNGIYKRFTRDFEIYTMEEWQDGKKVRVICEYGINCPENEISW